MATIGAILMPAINAIKPRVDDSGTDRLNYYYTAMVIFTCSIIITATQYVGSPLQCWVPAHFKSPWEQYAENYCFVYNTYWVKPEEQIPGSQQQRVAQQLIYYQWVPFLMALEAIFFYIPAMFWGQMSSKSGLNVINLVNTAQQAEKEEEDKRREKVKIIVKHINDSIRLQEVRREGQPVWMKILKFGLLDGSYLANVYVVTKFLYVLNLIGQFFMMNKFLGQNDPYWGAKIFNDIMHGTDWELSGNFPRIAMCDFQIRVLGHLQRYSIQCVLSLNMFNEKIFLFLYWWFIIVLLLTIWDMIDLWRETRSADEKKMVYVRQFVQIDDDRIALDFCKTKITCDVIVLLKFVSNHSTEVITTDILNFLLDEYRANGGYFVEDKPALTLAMKEK